MILSAVLWILVWGGMFSDLDDLLEPERLWLTAFSVLKGFRTLFPLLALYFCLLWFLFRRPRASSLGSPLGLLFAYCGVGLLSSIFLSVEPWTSLYWVGLYLAPLSVVWFALEREATLRALAVLQYVNYAVFGLLTLSLLPEALRVGWGHLPPFQQYTLAFDLGTIRTNGAGRFALVVIIVAAVRFITRSDRFRWLWLLAFPPGLFLLTQTQSRTALLGLAVAGVLFVFLRGLDWRYVFAGPVAAGVIYLSGFQWRIHGDMDLLLHLTGREYTWQKGLARIAESPFLGWGFHADRIMLNQEHMHNSFLHAGLHTGIAGVIFFVAAFAAAWFLILKSGVFRRVRDLGGEPQALLMESTLIVGFLTSRSFFESTAAFYGVDLLLLIPALAYLAASPRAEAGP